MHMRRTLLSVAVVALATLGVPALTAAPAAVRTARWLKVSWWMRPSAS